MQKYKVKKIIGLFLSLLFISCPLTANASIQSDEMTLEQVVIFSRHSLRSPLFSPESPLGKVSAEAWPQLDTPSGHLTLRGAVLETYLGHYFNDWFTRHNLLAENKCPSTNDVIIYANSMQRTVATAQFFSASAFPGCDVPVFYQKERFGAMDPLFDIAVKDGSAAYKQSVIASMNQTAGEGGISGLNKRLQAKYDRVADIVGYSKSANCKGQKLCNFTDQGMFVRVERDKDAIIRGALNTGNLITDAFVMQYYEGFSFGHHQGEPAIAWGGVVILMN